MLAFLCVLLPEGTPRPWAPFSLTLLPALLIPLPLTGLLHATAFVLTASRLLARERPPLWPAVAAAVAALLHVAFLAASWTYGVAYQGALHTVVVAVVSTLAAAACVLLLVLARRRSSMRLCFWGTWASFAWLVWWSFPWLGELL